MEFSSCTGCCPAGSGDATGGRWNTESLAQDPCVIAETFTSYELQCQTMDEDCGHWYKLVFEKLGVNSNCKDNESEWLLLSLREISWQFHTK